MKPFFNFWLPVTDHKDSLTIDKAMVDCPWNKSQHLSVLEFASQNIEQDDQILKGNRPDLFKLWTVKY